MGCDQRLLLRWGYDQKVGSHTMADVTSLESRNALNGGVLACCCCFKLSRILPEPTVDCPPVPPIAKLGLLELLWPLPGTDKTMIYLLIHTRQSTCKHVQLWLKVRNWSEWRNQRMSYTTYLIFVYIRRPKANFCNCSVALSCVVRGALSQMAKAKWDKGTNRPCDSAAIHTNSNNK